VWEQLPHLRLGQLFVLAARPNAPCPELFYLEDDALLQGLATYKSQLAAARGEPAEVEVVLGEEFDQALFDHLVAVVRAAGGNISEASHGVGGSQELITYDVTLPTGSLVVIAETYAGLSVRGPAALVEEIRCALHRAYPPPSA
jgi:hypothetical protein